MSSRQVIHTVGVGAAFVGLTASGACARNPPPGSPGPLVPLSTQSEVPDVPSAKDILARMIEVYAGARTYRDTGRVRTAFSSGFTTERQFKTAFVRPDRFRFEYSEAGRPMNRYIVWAIGRDVRTWWGIRLGVNRAPSIGHAMGAAAGVSGRASMTVPTLLLPKESVGAGEAGAKLLVYVDPVRLPDEVIEGVGCFRLAVKCSDEPIALWLDSGSYLIRRIESSRRFDDFQTNTVTAYEPAINATVDEQLLAFGAPGRTNDSGGQVVLSFDPQGADFAAWVKSFRSDVYKNWIMPQVVVEGVTGQTAFECTVERDGSISAIRILKSSGTALLDEAAQDALRKSRLRALPKGYGPPRAAMRVTFHYNEAPQAH